MQNKLIGSTPLIKINYKYKGNTNSIYAKLEYYNYSGSIKDRIASYIINKAKENGTLKENQPIIEATSGNTGIAFAALGARYHHPVHIFLPDWVSVERKQILELYGAHVHLVSKEEGGFKQAIFLADKLASEINGFRPNQFDNYDNILAHYETTGEEIIKSLPNVSTFVSGIGTGGTLIGVGKRLKEYNSAIQIVALEPDTMAILSGGKIESHKIEGIGDDFIPSIVDQKIIDKIVTISGNEAIIASRLLASKLGLAVGISSGANFLASIMENKPNVVTVFPDNAFKYLSTDLTKKTSIPNSSILNDIELLNLEVI